MSSMVFKLNGSIADGMIAAGERFNAAFLEATNDNGRKIINDFFKRCRALEPYHEGGNDYPGPALDITYFSENGECPVTVTPRRPHPNVSLTFREDGRDKRLSVQPARDEGGGARTNIIIPRDKEDLLGAQTYLDPIVEDIVDNISEDDQRVKYLLSTIMFRRCA